MGVLSGLSPERVFYYFEELTKLPHGSGDTKAVTEYLEAFAKEHSLKSRTDSYGNVVIFADGTAGYESSPAVILQGHFDMVAVKTADSSHDFHTDGLDLVIEGDDIRARGTSLGGDDGIAVAYMLAILEDGTVPHPPLDCVFTADEEVGMLGAAAFDASVLRGKQMINLDSEEEGVFICGCAGGARMDAVLPIRRANVKGIPVVITIDGLTGGHSGAMITSGRPSANQLMGRFLLELSEKSAYSIERISGGEKDNAIAVVSKAHLVTDEDEFEAMEAFAMQYQEDLRREYLGIDGGITIHIAKGEARTLSVLDIESQDKALFLLVHSPQGLRKRNGLIPEAAETSSNLGIVRTTDREFVCAELIRSSAPSGRRALMAEFRSLGEFIGADVRVSEDYPEWPYRDDSPLKNKMTEIYREVTGNDPKIEVTHGGIECGVFSKKIPGFDAVSIGPKMTDIHTTDERLSISSASRTWDYLLKVLEALK